MHIDDLEKQRKLRKLRDRPLKFDRKPIDETGMMEALQEEFGFPTITRILRARALLALVLCVVHNSKWGHFTSYSRRENWYKAKREVYGDHFTYCHIMHALDSVKGTGMFIDIRVNPGTHNKKQSALMASVELINLVQRMAFTETEHKSMVVKDDDGAPIELEDTEFSIQRRKDLKLINTFYNQHMDISFPEEYRTGGSRYRVEGFEVDVSPLQVHCVFNRSSWDFGGRLYGWTTSLSKDVRKHILINNEPTIDLDFKQYHPSILFAKEGIQIDRDVYDIGDYPRDWYKIAFLAALNGQNCYSSAFQMYLNNGKKLGFALKDAQAMVKKIVECTPEISKYFFADTGVKLQRLDSDIIIDILKSLIDKGIPALSVHDSVRVQCQHESITRRIMNQSYYKFNHGYSCGVA